MEIAIRIRQQDTKYAA